MRSRRPAGLVLSCVVVVIGAGCGSSGANDNPTISAPVTTVTPGPATPASCPSAMTATPTHPLPARFPTLPAEHVYSFRTTGGTKVYYATVPGNPATVVATRDRLIAGLLRHGYREQAHHQQPGRAADADFSGPLSGNLRVGALCAGHLEVRYVISGGG